jgi:hypothetical protein
VNAYAEVAFRFLISVVGFIVARRVIEQKFSVVAGVYWHTCSYFLIRQRANKFLFVTIT